MTPNEIADAAKDRARKCPELEQPLRDMWEAIKTDISVMVAKSGKKWKVYEIHNVDRVARLELLTAFVEGCELEVCADRARKSVGVPT